MKVNDIWFNPLLEKSVSTNDGKIVLPLISNHLSRRHKLHEVFNCNFKFVTDKWKTSSI